MGQGGQWVNSVGESRLAKLASVFSLSYVWTFGGAGETSLAEDQQTTYSSFLSPMGRLELKRITEQTEAMQCLVVEQAHPQFCGAFGHLHPSL